MKKIWAISYSDDSFSMSKKLNLLTAKYIGKASKTISYSPEDLDEKFVKDNHEILRLKRGAGYWIWKPYIMLKTLELLDDGDYLIYTDSGLIYVDKIEKLIRQLERDKQDVFLSYGIAPCKDWCKRDAFVLMECDCKEAQEAIMVSGGYVLVKKSDESIEFINEWLKSVTDYRIVTDFPNQCGLKNYSGFRENRHDQTVLSLLAWKYKVKPYKAVSCADQPSAYLSVKNHVPNAYKYSYQKILELIYFEHQTEGYKKSDYGRIFVNTRLKNMPAIKYVIELVKIIYKTKKDDDIGKKNNEIELEKAKKRLSKGEKV